MFTQRDSAQTKSMITPSIKQQFDAQGYYFAKNVFSKDEIAALTKDFDKVVRQLQNGQDDPNGRWTSESLDNIEAKSIDKSIKQTSIVHSHMIHRYSALWAKAMHQPKFIDISRKILGKDIVLHHNKLFYKPPKKGSAFPVHQDWAYFPTQLDTMIAGVIHLTEANDEIGCIRVFPGSHTLGRLSNSDGTVANEIIDQQYPLEKSIPMIAEPGDVLFFSYFTLHGSKPNISSQERKTVLVQMHAGADQPEKNDHPYDRLVLSGMNPYMTRSLGNK